MALALYRKYRSRSLDDIVGQDHVTNLLRNAIQNDRVAHAYLFTGPRGTGKTSIARIIAHAINDLPYEDDSTHLDIIEIDAASNNSVDDIRELRERVQISPVSAKKKIYIIDEVHMLSKQAFNALLKTLEEPPEHIIFILATTDIDKVPATILSRTQRHTFRRAISDDIVHNLSRIAKHESIHVDKPALALIAVHSNGSFRDSVSLFDQLTSGLGSETLTADRVRESLGLAHDELIDALVLQTFSGDIEGIRQTITSLEQSGVPARTTADQIIHSIKDKVSEHPAYIELMDKLLDLGRSPYPELKLLTILSLFSPHDTSKEMPQQIATPVPTSPKAKTMSSPESHSKSNEHNESVTTIKTPLPPVTESPSVTPKPNVSSKTSDVPFNWNTLIEYVRTHHVAMHSVLSKCQPMIDGNKLILYTKSAFYKKKLDDVRYRVLLSDSLEAVHMGGLEIDTVPTGLPVKDSDAAKIVAIMGGGEEVTLDE